MSVLKYKKNGEWIPLPISGGGKLQNYEDVHDKPSINDVTLSGNKTLDDLGIQSKLTKGANINIDNDVISAEKTTESEISDMGFTKNTGTYSKPDSGIPKADLDSEMKGVADNALQLTAIQEKYDANTCYDGKVWLITQGSNCPTSNASGKQYGSLFTMPYRKANGNTKPDFGTQIYIPNGDDKKPNSMFFRTSLADSWNPWQEVTRGGHVISILTQSEYNALSTKDDDTIYIVKP